MEWKNEWKILAVIVAVFLLAFYLPVGNARFDAALTAALLLVKWYAREHVLTCLVPAFFIAGAISVFVSQASVMKYLGPNANKGLAYGVASVSGTILAVCSCTVLPLFAGIYKMGAGLGPASAFLYSGPAINVLAIVLTARVLGLQIGVARAAGAVLFSVLIGLAMAVIFRREETEKAKAQFGLPEPEVKRPLWKNAAYFGLLAAILVFANWSKGSAVSGFFYAVYSAKWYITACAAAALAVVLVAWFGVPSWKMLLVSAATILAIFVVPDNHLLPFGAAALGLAVATATGKGEDRQWFDATWGYTKQILPLLLGGVFVSGILLGFGNHVGLIPSKWVSSAVGGNSLFANFFASVAGALMYFATLTEVPILQGLMNSGMGSGPALALLLAGPALSLPSMIVLTSIMGAKKTLAFVSLVVVMATISGIIFGAIVG